jgi:MFS family permease
MYKKTLRQYYILSCLFNTGGLQIICAIYVAFLMKNGLNLLQVNLVNAAYFLTMFICEIPTGAFADIFGRKKAFVTACAIMCGSMVVYGLSHTFTGFLIAEVMAAIGCTFRSGAFQAWMVDSLKHQGYTGELRPIFSRNSMICQIGSGVGAITGSYLYVVNPALPWLVGGASMALTTVVAFFIMKEDYFVKAAFSWKRGLVSMGDIARKSMRYGLDDKAVRFVLIVTGMQIFSVQALNMYWQPFFKGQGISEQHLGFIFVGVIAMMAMGAWLALHMDVNGKEKRMILMMQAIAGLLAMAAPLVPGALFMVAIYLLHELPRGACSPLMDSYLQKRIPSGERATITSFCAVAPHIGGAIGLVVSGVIAQCFGITVAWVISGMSLIVGAIVISRNGNGKSEE